MCSVTVTDVSYMVCLFFYHMHLDMRQVHDTRRAAGGGNEPSRLKIWPQNSEFLSFSSSTVLTECFSDTAVSFPLGQEVSNKRE